MINEQFLRDLCDLDEKEADYDELVDNLPLLEKAQAKIHRILLNARMKKLMADFGERDTDIYVVSFPRSGTTLMQMILYQMTTDGDMSFQHIYDVSPWCRFSAFFNRAMPSLGERRIIKSHDDYSVLEQIKKGKFIFMIRDCLDVISSVHQQTLDYVNPAADFNELSNRNMERWLSYNNDWIRNRSRLDVLYVHYEEVVRDKQNAIKSIAEFLEVEIDEPTLQRVMDRTSFEFMKQHESKFGEQPDHWKVYNNFIRSGRIGEGKAEFSKEQIRHLKELSANYDVKGTPFERYLSI
ncbi:MAG: sulfotransferase domain-containing protein [Saprospiraceae bacterium]|nr:sulfotransferase domain-containing protein [Lewinella sp.]